MFVGESVMTSLRYPISPAARRSWPAAIITARAVCILVTSLLTPSGHAIGQMYDIVVSNAVSTTIVRSQITFAKHGISSGLSSPRSVHPADVDGDGDTDVIGAVLEDDEVLWWENADGVGTLWSEHTIEVAFDGAIWVHAADFDDDGDLDVLGAARLADDITWWE